MVNASLFSGGKDSVLALHKAIESGIEIDLLITMQSANEYSYMFHYPNIDATGLQAEALGIKQIIMRTEGKSETELLDLESALVDNEVNLVVSGAIASNYQKERLDKITKAHSIKSVTPLWGIKPEVELEEITQNFDSIITQVSAEGFDKSYLGAKIDNAMVEKLKDLNSKYGINMLFEGGEAETFVRDAPLFKKKIVIDQSDTVWQGQVGRYLITKAHLADKDK
ncbi:MAG: diphthine--ammonia ligase [Candidatus Micrarchaeales archaeon]